MNISENITTSMNATSFFQGLTVGERLIILSIILSVFLFFLKLWWDVRHKNYFDRKQEHIDKLVKNILNRWITVKCELVSEFAVEDHNFILLKEFSSISKHKDFNFAVEHIKKYPCWEVWEGVMDSFNNLNNLASEILNELNEAIGNRLNAESFSSDFNIRWSTILDQVVKILIDKILIEDRGCDEYIQLRHETKEVRTYSVRYAKRHTGCIIAEGGDMQDLETFKRIICEFIGDEYYQKKVSYLLRECKKINRDVKTFTDKLRDICNIAEHRQELKGKCGGCPRILRVFRP